MTTIIFVCHGNICRSPAAEIIALDWLTKHHLAGEVRVFSRATSYEEIGNPVYPPMRRALEAAGYKVPLHRASRLTQKELDEADAVYYMDGSNRRNLSYSFADHRRVLAPITCLCPDLDEIEDPWYTGNFDLVVKQIERCVEAIFSHRFSR